MSHFGATPWHRDSWDKFINGTLPELLGERLPLTSYSVTETGTYTCTVTVGLDGEEGEIELVYDDIPQPDADGIFKMGPREWVERDDVPPVDWGGFRVVVPVPSSRDLATAEIKCVGEQLYDFIASCLKEVPEELQLTRETARSWLPLDKWMRDEFLRASQTSHFLQVTNWIDRVVHRRRVIFTPLAGQGAGPAPLGREEVLLQGLPGRVCPLTLPEGPNMGRVFEVATGAEIRDGRLVIVDDSDQGKIGVGASMIPFLEHSDPNRLLMGANMIRQWFTPRDTSVPGGPGLSSQILWENHHERLLSGEAPCPEPALVQTGFEVDTPDFWGGYNLLTAYILWDGYGYEDAIVISESCAEKISFPSKAEVGDKLSTRHGSKGVIGQILPDLEMPQTSDGRSVELIFNITSLISRQNFGMVREAVMGRIAQAEGETAIVPPFAAPSEAELKERLKRAGLAEDGMDALTVNGEALPFRSTIGPVYWGRLVHDVASKIHASVDAGAGQRLGEGAYEKLRDLGAFEIIGEHLNTCSAYRGDAESLAERVAQGSVEQAGPPSPVFERLKGALQITGIRATLEDTQLVFDFDQTDGLKLARPVPHPWLPEREVERVPAFEALGEFTMMVKSWYDLVEEANQRLAQMLASNVPDTLVQNALAQLQNRVEKYFEVVVREDNLKLQTRVMFSGRSVVAPGPDLAFDQVGLPEEIAWTLFGPQVARAVGDPAEVQQRTPDACDALDELMAKSWVVVFKDPSSAQTPFIAFHPVLINESAIRIHLGVTTLMDTDFDGDQLGVFLPITEAGQKEAEEKLSVLALLQQNPERLDQLLHRPMGAAAGLYLLTRKQSEGFVSARKEISELTGVEVGCVNSRALRALAREVFAQQGPERALAIVDELLKKGFEAAKKTGASVSPFLGSQVVLPDMPAGNDPDEWQVYFAEVIAHLVTHVENADGSAPDLETYYALVDSGSRGSWPQVARHICGWGPVKGFDGEQVVIKRGFRDGLTATEMIGTTAGMIGGIAQANTEWLSYQGDGRAARGVYPLARARHAKKPGLVFARAAHRGEIEPLKDVYSRLFVGLPAKSQT